MEKFIRIFNQNRKDIYKLIGIVLLGYTILLITNTMMEQKVKKQKNESTQSVASDTQAESKNTVKNKNTSTESNIVQEFLNYCMDDEQKAYEVLSNETKENSLYSTKEAFINNFINAFVKTGDKNDIEKIKNDMYIVQIYNSNILSTGSVKDTKIKYLKIQDNKITIQEYIEKKDIDKKYLDDNLYINIKEITYYKYYAICKLIVTNNSSSNINIKDTYILSNKSEKFKNIENNNLELKSYENKTLELKYSIDYTYANSLNKIVFELNDSKIDVEL